MFERLRQLLGAAEVPAAEDDFEALLARLVGLLTELRDLLAPTDPDWSHWVGIALHEIQNFDRCGLDRLRKGFGEMGSFNDLVIGPADGERFTGPEIDLNNRVGRPRSECYSLVTELRRQLPA